MYMYIKTVHPVGPTEESKLGDMKTKYIERWVVKSHSSWHSAKVARYKTMHNIKKDVHNW